jgi:serine/threonine-protein kinase
MVGDAFGPYRLEELLGRGGMGEVHRAYDTVKQRTVALKRLHPHLADDRQFTARFRREAQVAARLSEPHIIPIHDFGEIDGRLFIDMRIVEGTDLDKLLASTGPLSATRAVGIVSQVAAALAAAHKAQLIHRDVKPSNVMLVNARHQPGDDHQDYAYLVDFGIAHAGAATSMTGTGVTVGTLAYMAPEQFLGREVDHRVDIYSLGCVLYQILTGQLPFPGEAAAALMYGHLNTPPPAPSQLRPDLPDALDRVVTRALAKDPDERYPTATEFATDARRAVTNSLRVAITPPPTTTQPPTVDEPAVADSSVTPTRSEDLGEPTPPPPTERAPTAAIATPEPPVTTVGTATGERRSISTRKALVIGLAVLALIAAGVVALARNRSASPLVRQPSVVTTIPLAASPQDIAVAPDGRVFVAQFDDQRREGWRGKGSIAVLDPARNALAGELQIGDYADFSPYRLAVTPDSRLVLATINAVPSNALVIDTVSNAVIAKIAPPGGVGLASRVVVAPDGLRAYVYDYYDKGSVRLVDTSTNTVVDTVDMGCGRDQDVEDVAISRDSRRLYVSCKGGLRVLDTTTRAVVVAEPRTTAPGSVAAGSDETLLLGYANRLAFVDEATNTTTADMPLPADSGQVQDVAVSPDGQHGYALTRTTSSGDSPCVLHVIDMVAHTTIASVPVGTSRSGYRAALAVSPDGRRAYVSWSSSASVVVVDTGSN